MGTSGANSTPPSAILALLAAGGALLEPGSLRIPKEARQSLLQGPPGRRPVPVDHRGHDEPGVLAEHRTLAIAEVEKGDRSRYDDEDVALDERAQGAHPQRVGGLRAGQDVSGAVDGVADPVREETRRPRWRRRRWTGPRAGRARAGRAGCQDYCSTERSCPFGPPHHCWIRPWHWGSRSATARHIGAKLESLNKGIIFGSPGSIAFVGLTC